MYITLDTKTLPDVLRRLRKLRYPDHEPYLLKCALKVVKGRFGHMGLIAALVAGLSKLHPEVGVALVDLLLEEVRWGLDRPGDAAFQRRVAHMRLLGR